MKKLPYLILLIFCFACNENKQDKFESEVCDCITLGYDSVGFEFETELLKFEKHIIDEGYLKDASGESYVRIIGEIAQLNDNPITTDYEIKGLDYTNFSIFKNCFYLKTSDSLFLNSYSKLKDVYNVLNNNQTPEMGPIATDLLKVLDANDFEKKIYKMYALNTLYFTSSQEPSGLPLPN